MLIRSILSKNILLLALGGLLLVSNASDVDVKEHSHNDQKSAEMPIASKAGAEGRPGRASETSRPPSPSPVEHRAMMRRADDSDGRPAIVTAIPAALAAQTEVEATVKTKLKSSTALEEEAFTDEEDGVEEASAEESDSDYNTHRRRIWWDDREHRRRRYVPQDNDCPLNAKTCNCASRRRTSTGTPRRRCRYVLDCGAEEPEEFILTPRRRCQVTNWWQ
mmetsp:Transcript_51621/g.109690  ORF Transcript_51621/g.109690 Transcript_51621/m.109690 type:complete len:220 (-) Transcript_51621:105-764(-)